MHYWVVWVWLQALNREKLDVAELLVSKGADVNARPRGYSLLHLALVCHLIAPQPDAAVSIFSMAAANVFEQLCFESFSLGASLDSSYARK